MQIQFGKVVRPMEGEFVSGDGVVARDLENYFLFCIFDVLGHGKDAHEAAKIIENFIKNTESRKVSPILEALDLELKSYRGAAVFLGIIEKKFLTLHYAAIGNITGRFTRNQEKSLISKEGVVGERMRNVFVQNEEIKSGDHLIFYSDGIKAHFDLPEISDHLENLAQGYAERILYLYGKKQDDASCLVIRCL